MTSSTNIESLMKDMNTLDDDENKMVNSIINDLNSSETKPNSQQKMPQITDEEREMLIRQQKQEQIEPRIGGNYVQDIHPKEGRQRQA